MKQQEYLLACLVEELSEVQQAVCKCLRFTPNDRHPMKQTTNKQDVEAEIADVLAIIQMLKDCGFKIEIDKIRINSKIKRTRSYMEYSIITGALDDNSYN